MMISHNFVYDDNGEKMMVVPTKWQLMIISVGRLA